jgi:hypothetical protein
MAFCRVTYTFLIVKIVVFVVIIRIMVMIITMVTNLLTLLNTNVDTWIGVQNANVQRMHVEIIYIWLRIALVMSYCISKYPTSPSPIFPLPLFHLAHTLLPQLCLLWFLQYFPQLQFVMLHYFEWLIHQILLTLQTACSFKCLTLCDDNKSHFGMSRAQKWFTEQWFSPY